MNNNIDKQTHKQFKRKKLKFSLLFKLLFPTLVIITTLGVSLSTVSYNIQKENLLNDAKNTSKIVAHIAANTVDPSLFNNIHNKEDITTSAYASMFNSLTYVNSKNVVKYIYSIYFQNGEMYYGVDTDPNIPNRYMPGDLYTTNFKDEYNILISGKTFTSNTITYDYEKPIIYSISPVKNANGVIVGAIGCDYDLSTVYDKLNSTTKKLTLITIIAILLTTIIITLVLHAVIQHIRIINNKMITIVNNEGDLTQQISITSRDLLGNISKHTNKFMECIRRLMIKIQKGSKEIDTSVKHSYKDMQIASEDINNTNNSLKVVNTSMITVVESCNIIESTSSIILNTVNNINSLINKGVHNAMNIKDYAISSNEENTKKYEEAKAKAVLLSKKLNEQLQKAKELNKVANLANDIIQITDQTNILALNASIEAAKSGESGKGFAIVAEEISKLASTTGNSANQIGEVTSTVINSVNELSTYAEKMLKFLNKVLFKGFDELVENSTVYSNDSQKLANILVSFAESTMSLSANIEEVQASLKLVTSHINDNAGNIDTITVISSELTDRISKLHIQIDKIKQAGEELNEEVNRFKV